MRNIPIASYIRNEVETLPREEIAASQLERLRAGVPLRVGLFGAEPTNAELDIRENPLDPRHPRSIRRSRNSFGIA